VSLQSLDFEIQNIFLNRFLSTALSLNLSRFPILVLISLNIFMAYWLVKSEPSKYSYLQLEKDKKTIWDGIRNYASRIHLRAMKKGDEVLFYHSNEGLEIVGVAKVAKEAYPDPSAGEQDWVAIDLKPDRRLKKPVSLSKIKDDKRLGDMALVRLGRLSVQPVTDKEWAIVMELAAQ
jgi:predicted RNA-binding protein with PUA-like domain